MLETDAAGQVISYEEYHPFGTSAYRVSKSTSDLETRYAEVPKGRYLQSSGGIGFQHGGAEMIAVLIAD